MSAEGMNTNDMGDPSSPQFIEADLERQRDELAATVNELQARLDVKSRAKAKAADLKDRATTSSGKPRPDLAVAAALAAVAVIGFVIWRARR